MNEFITGIRVIKLHGWENSFAKLIETCRRLFKNLNNYLQNFLMNLLFLGMKLNLFDIRLTAMP